MKTLWSVIEFGGCHRGIHDLRTFATQQEAEEHASLMYGTLGGANHFISSLEVSDELFLDLIGAFDHKLPYCSQECADKNVAEEERRTCRPGGSFVHVRPESGWPAPVHWQICHEHKKRWRWGQNMISAPVEWILAGEKREKFFREYAEGHCPGYGEYEV